MADEIEEFIRRAAERRKQQGQRKPPAKPSAPPATANRPRPQLATPLAPPVVVEAEIIPAQVGEHVSSHVATHLSTKQFNERAAHLGEETALADDRLEAHLHQKFDHKLGSLAQSGPAASSVAVGPGPALAPATLVEMLRSPQHLRNAILLSEVLTRPEHHW